MGHTHQKTTVVGNGLGQMTIDPCPVVEEISLGPQPRFPVAGFMLHSWT